MRRRVLVAIATVGMAAGLLSPISGPASAAEPRAAAARTDFNGDGFADLAVDVPSENLGPTEDAGAVTIIQGSATGLGGEMTTWHQDSPGVGGQPADYDNFGRALATGDFDRDGFADLAIGTENDDPDGIVNTGAVNVLYGSADGLTSARSQYWRQDSPAVVDVSDPGDGFGTSLAAADFDGDGFADLAVGVPSEDLGSLQNAGAVIVLRGSADGLTGTGSRIIHKDRPGVVGQAKEFEEFGTELAAGNLGRGPFADLAVGTPSEGVGDAGRAGAVSVLYGSETGLTATGSEVWSQDSPGILGHARESDRFGYSLAVGDLGGSSHGDLVVGVPFSEVGFVPNAGAVSVIYGSPTGLTAQGNQIWTQDSPGVIGIAEGGDLLGLSLAVGNLGNGTRADIVVGVPREDAGGDEAGVVNVLYGSASGVSAEDNQLWYQDSPGVAGGAEDHDWFANALAIGDFGGGAPRDLAVGVPVEAIGSIQSAGAINVLYGSVSGLTAEGNLLWSQDSDGSDDAAETGDGFGGSLAST
jgi:hypothetical protein